VMPDEYCREIEAYLTRKNDGHLVRIVGPSFERVRGWAEQGVPLKVAFAGIDRHFQRYYAKGPRRRPVRIDHCEADVLDVFDEWRRAVGVTAGMSLDREAPARPRNRDALSTRLERALARLTMLRAEAVPTIPTEVLAQAVSDLDAMIPAARSARRHVREALKDRLAELDMRLMSAARGGADATLLAELRDRAAGDLQPFAERMPAEAWQRAITAAVDRALRERLGLPLLAEL
jgi:hypothetical protein